MLLYLTEWLAEYDTAFNVFQYLTLRTILGVLTALMISLLVGPTMIRRLSFHQIGQTVVQSLCLDGVDSDPGLWRDRYGG